MLWQVRASVVLGLVASICVLQCGCHVKNQIYRPVSFAPEKDLSDITVPEAPSHLPIEEGSGWPRHPEARCDRNDLRDRPCLAFLEFDDFGETWQRNPSGRPSQLQNITSLIARAKEAEGEDKSPLVITFLHGWKHNAAIGNQSGADDPNIIGFATVLNQLKKVMPGKVIIGVYLSWRGDLISQYWPVSRQLTYWNREATAIKVGNTSLTEALIEISDATKSHCPSCIVVFTGHSFGALALERAISQAMITRLEQAWVEARQPDKPFPGGRIPVNSLANLIIYVNSAAAASESKQMMDYLASSRYIYQPESSEDKRNRNPSDLSKDLGGQKLNQPLILSVTSEADLATGLALKVGHAIPLLGLKWNGSLRPKGTESASEQPTSEYTHACFDPLPDERAQSFRRFDLSQSDYYMSTAAHLQPLWSHQVLSEKISNSVADPRCESRACFKNISVG